MSTNRALLKAEQIEKHFGSGHQRTSVLLGVSASFVQGESYAIIGASGSGKSTFLHIIGGLDEPSSGLVSFNEQNCALLSKKQRDDMRNRLLGFVFQFHYLIHELTALENVMMPGLIAGRSMTECRTDALTLLKSVGLEHRINSMPGTLSGGEQQRVAVARALFNKPAFLLADEPTGNLDAENGALVIDLLHHYQREYGMGLIVCSHDAALYGKMESVLTLHNGRLIA